MALTDEVQKVGGSTKQELYDRNIYWWFEDEKDLKDDLEWQLREEERVEGEWFRLTSEWRYAGRLELSVLYARESAAKLYTEFFHLF